jgi:hypothetical protein
MSDRIRLVNEDGYIGTFSRDQVSGVIPNGTTIRKVKTEDGDAHPVGALGVVLGSIQIPTMPIFYFIEWEALPGYAVGVIDWKIAPCES